MNSDTCPCKVEDSSEPVAETDEVVKYEKDITSEISSRKLVTESTQVCEKSIIFNYMVNLLERTMDKLELAATVPLLLQNPEIARILTKDELNIITDAFSANELADAYHVHETQSTTGCAENNDVSLWESAVTDSRTFQALEILHSYPRIRELSKASQRDASTAATLFLQHMRYFVEHVLSVARLTPEEARAKELHYRKAWRDHKQSLKDIITFTGRLEAQRKNYKRSIESIIVQYKKDMLAVESINRKYAENLKNITIKSERKQLQLYKMSEAKQSEMRIALTNAKSDLEALRKKNLDTERSIRARRFKTQSQLQAIINKFDTEIGERQRLFEELLETYQADKVEKDQLTAFITNFERQAEKEAEEEEEGGEEEEEHKREELYEHETSNIP